MWGWEGSYFYKFAIIHKTFLQYITKEGIGANQSLNLQTGKLGCKTSNLLNVAKMAAWLT